MRVDEDTEFTHYPLLARVLRGMAMGLISPVPALRCTKGRPLRNGPSAADSSVSTGPAIGDPVVRSYRMMLNRCTVLFPFTVMFTM